MSELIINARTQRERERERERARERASQASDRLASSGGDAELGTWLKASYPFVATPRATPAQTLLPTVCLLRLFYCWLQQHLWSFYPPFFLPPVSTIVSFELVKKIAFLSTVVCNKTCFELLRRKIALNAKFFLGVQSVRVYDRTISDSKRGELSLKTDCRGTHTRSAGAKLFQKQRQFACHPLYSEKQE